MDPLEINTPSPIGHNNAVMELSLTLLVVI